jgi:DNA-binding GntR family transcriptional regulator
MAQTAEPRTMTQSLVERLRADILAGTLEPGARLKLPALSERYGTSLIPIREALARLAPQGLVQAEKQRGFRVAPVSREHLIDVTETRVGIEALALEKAMRRGDVEWEARVLSAHHRLSREPMTIEGDERTLSPAWERLHVQYHDALVSGCGLPTLLGLRRQLADQTTRYRRLSVAYDDEGRDVAEEHVRLSDAVLARDVETALQHLSDHFWATTWIVLRGLGWPQPEVRT